MYSTNNCRIWVDRVKYKLSIMAVITVIWLTGCGSKNTAGLSSYDAGDPVIGVVMAATGDTVYSVEDYERLSKVHEQGRNDVSEHEYATVQDASDYNLIQDIPDASIQQDSYSSVVPNQDIEYSVPTDNYTEYSQPYTPSVNQDVVSVEPFQQEVLLPENGTIEGSDNIRSIDDVPVQNPSSGSNHRGNVDNFYTYDNPEQQKTTAQYVLNTNTMKFHVPDCEWVKRIAPEHYLPSSDREEIIAQGYIPCKVCNP